MKAEESHDEQILPRLKIETATLPYRFYPGIWFVLSRTKLDSRLSLDGELTGERVREAENFLSGVGYEKTENFIF